MRLRHGLFAAMQTGGKAATPWYLSGGVAAANCIAAYQPKGAASYAASLVNLANPGTYNAAEGVAPDWTAANGWAGGVGKYLLTGITPDSYNWSMAVRVSGVNYHANYAPCGSRAGATSNTFYFLLTSSENVRYAYGYSNSEVIPSFSTGSLMLAGIYGYRNGVLDSTGGTQSNGIPSKEVYLLGINNNGSLGFNQQDGYLYAFAIYNTVISDAQALAIHTAMAAL